MATDATPPRPPLVTSASEPTSEERTLALLCHLGGFFTWFVLPVILWQVKKNDSRFLDDHGKEAVNFQIALTIYYFVGCLLIVVWIPVLIYEIVVVIQACLAANRGQMYRYPLNIRFIK